MVSRPPSRPSPRLAFARGSSESGEPDGLLRSLGPAVGRTPQSPVVVGRYAPTGGDRPPEGARMSDTRTLLDRIASFRERPDRTPNLIPVAVH